MYLKAAVNYKSHTHTRRRVYTEKRGVVSKRRQGREKREDGSEQRRKSDVFAPSRNGGQRNRTTFVISNLSALTWV